MTIYDIGDAVRISVAFTSGGTAVDPTTVTLMVQDPSGNAASYTYALAQVIKDTTGAYHKDITVDESGTWFYRWTGTGLLIGVYDGYVYVKRSTMGQLVTQLRAMSNAGTADYTIGADTYWSDKQLEDALDRYRTDVYHEQLSIVQTWPGGGSVEYKVYQSHYRHFEMSDGGSAVFYLEDGLGANVSAGTYTPDYNRGVVTFASDTGGSVYYLTGRSYNLNAAAADIWRAKAAHYSAAVNFSTDNMKVDRGALMANALKMADYYENMGGPVMTEVWRDDIA